MLRGVAIGQLLDEWPGQLVGAAGFAAVILLWAGWWAQRDDWMGHGLLVTVGVWASVWAIVLLDTEWSNVSGWLAFAWALASAGRGFWRSATRGRGERHLDRPCGSASVRPSALYLSKRLIDYVLPAGPPLPWLDKFTTPTTQHTRRNTNEYS